MTGNSGPHQSDEEKRGSDGGHHMPHETRGPGWRTWVACTQLPGGRAMPGKGGHHRSDEREREAVMVATTYPMKPGALGGKPGWPAPHEKEEEPCLETVAVTSQMEKKEWQ